MGNHGPVTRFAARGVGEEGDQPVWAPLSDPSAKPGEEHLPAVDAGALSLAALTMHQVPPDQQQQQSLHCRIAARGARAAGGARGQAGIRATQAARGPRSPRAACGGEHLAWHGTHLHLASWLCGLQADTFLGWSQASMQYLATRVGVPRDLPLPAARQLRAHLNWFMDSLQL